MSNPSITDSQCIIVVEDLFTKINTQRKLLNRTPIENQAMATRLTLRFSVDKQRGVDFSAEKVLITPDEVDLLEKTVNELFGLFFDGELGRLCAKPKALEPVSASAIPPTPEPSPAPEKAGLISKLKSIFGGK